MLSWLASMMSRSSAGTSAALAAVRGPCNDSADIRLRGGPAAIGLRAAAPAIGLTVMCEKDASAETEVMPLWPNWCVLGDLGDTLLGAAARSSKGSAAKGSGLTCSAGRCRLPLLKSLDSLPNSASRAPACSKASGMPLWFRSAPVTKRSACPSWVTSSPTVARGVGAAGTTTDLTARGLYVVTAGGVGSACLRKISVSTGLLVLVRQPSCWTCCKRRCRVLSVCQPVEVAVDGTTVVVAGRYTGGATVRVTVGGR
mmetsp:Transcript_149125/g.260041  ORF Transcript_149125/g.260041 Transcript_149125/m.260041 type:complete len:256 (-) Transcript_149125:1625-2392(-)